MAEGKRGSNESRWWQDLMEVTHDQQLGNALQNETAWRVGCGDKIRFWEDCWTGDGVALMIKYPRLYQISYQQQKLIQQLGSFTETAWEWNFTWRRPLFDNEVDSAVGFLGEITQTAVQQHTADNWRWIPDPNGNYSTKSAYNLLQGESAEEKMDGVFEDLRKLRIPTKTSIFAWRLIRDRLPTKSNLRRRHVEINDSICPFCRNKEEDTAHLFFNCIKTLPLWWESLSWVNISGAFPQNPRQHFLQHGNGMNEGIRCNRWKCWWIALTWTIWQQRNRIIFSNETFNGSKLMDDALFLVWTWLRSMEKDFVGHFNQWSSNLTVGFCKLKFKCVRKFHSQDIWYSCFSLQFIEYKA